MSVHEVFGISRKCLRRLVLTSDSGPRAYKACSSRTRQSSRRTSRLSLVRRITGSLYFILMSDQAADLSAQGLISLHLLAAFPRDSIIGEEDTSELRRNDELRSKVVGLVNEHGRPDQWSEQQ